MGIIKRQGFYYTLISYSGVAIGAVNALFLYVRVFQISQIGEWNNLQAVGLIFTQLAQVGLPSIVSKFFPRFRSEDKGHEGLTAWVFLMAVFSFLTLSLLFLWFRPTIVSYYPKSPYFNQIFLLVLPYSFFLLTNAILDIFTRVIYKGLLFSFMNEVVVRLGTSIGLVAYYFHWIGFYQFLLLFIGLNGLITFALAIQVIRSGEYRVRFSYEFFRTHTPTLTQYGFYTFLAGSTFLMVQKADIIILTHFKGDSIQGVYSIFLYIIAVIRIPSIAIGRVSYQLVSDFWQNQDLPRIDGIYKKTSLVQMIIGLFLFLGLALNRDFLLFILKKPDFQVHFSLFYVLGLAVLVDTTAGLNTYILTVSHKFRVSAGILFFSVILCIGANYIFTPALGAMGAALSLLITYFFLNFCNSLYLKIRFNLQPFSRAHLTVLGIGILTFLAIYFIPLSSNHWVNLLVRSALVSLIFGALVVWLKVSEDINQQVKSIWSRFDALWPRKQ